MAIIERYPEVYQGAMPMCGPLEAAVDFLNNGLFDMLVTFEALFPGTIGSPYEPSAETGSKVKAAIAADPERAATYAQHYGRTVGQLPGVLSFFQVIASELKQRGRASPSDNRNHIYIGFGDDVALNRSIKRYAAVPAAREYVRQCATPTGRISDPMLTIHTTSDALVLGNDVTKPRPLSAYDSRPGLSTPRPRLAPRQARRRGAGTRPTEVVARVCRRQWQITLQLAQIMDHRRLGETGNAFDGLLARSAWARAGGQAPCGWWLFLFFREVASAREGVLK